MATLQKHRDALVNVSCVVFVAIVVVFFMLFTHPVHRGLFCDDDSIRYPLYESTVTTLTLCLVSFSVPLIAVLAVEGFRLFDTSTPRDSWHSVSVSLLRSLYEVYGIFLFGLGLNQTAVEIGKVCVGRLRPHFLDACKPFKLDCQEHVYITDYTCLGDPAVVEEARLSFPSGHAAMAFYTAVYVSVYLQHRLYWRTVQLPKHLAQGILGLFAWYTSLTRVQDHMHHPTDIIAGGVLGTFWAVFMTRYVIDMRLDAGHATKDELRSLRTPGSHIQGPNSV